MIMKKAPLQISKMDIPLRLNFKIVQEKLFLINEILNDFKS
jgi:hypothetical protein